MKLYAKFLVNAGISEKNVECAWREGRNFNFFGKCKFIEAFPVETASKVLYFMHILYNI
jgi:hypothetical protein